MESLDLVKPKVNICETIHYVKINSIKRKKLWMTPGSHWFYYTVDACKNNGLQSYCWPNNGTLLS